MSTQDMPQIIAGKVRDVLGSDGVRGRRDGRVRRRPTRVLRRDIRAVAEREALAGL